MDRHVVPFDGLLCPDDPWIDPRLAAELDHNERVIWAGRPIPGLLARRALPIVLFGIPWTAFSVFWTVMASGAMFSGSGPVAGGGIQWITMLFPMFGLPFIGIGLWMLSTPLRLKRYGRRGLYALTNRRCITWQQVSGKQVEVRSFPLAAGLSYKREERTDGRGSLVFLTGGVTERNDDSDSASKSDAVGTGFIGIDDVAGVERQLRDALELAAARGAISA